MYLYKLAGSFREKKISFNQIGRSSYYQNWFIVWLNAKICRQMEQKIQKNKNTTKLNLSLSLLHEAVYKFRRFKISGRT